MKTLNDCLWPAIRSIFIYLLDTIAPPDPAVRAIENMSLDEFMESSSEVTKTSGTANTIKPIDNILHLFPYRTDSGTVKTALVTIKTHHNPRLVKLIAGATYKKMSEKLAEKLPTEIKDKPFILIPVPMTKKSIRARGWNQCELICKEIAKLNAAAVKIGQRDFFEYRPDILIKIRETADQVGHGRAGRFENLKNSCVVRSGYEKIIAGRDIIVLDDIVTTGSTLSEARRALLAAGAKTVLCLAVAH